MRSRAAAFAAVMVVVSASATASAYCRTTTCSTTDPNNPCSFDNATGCTVGGKDLFWSNACVSFSVQKDGSPLRHISAAQAEKAIATGFSQWMGAECGGGAHPSITVSDRGLVSCNKTEYSSTDGNANIWMFRDGKWPYDDAGITLALTTITFNKQTGEIFDADVEIDSHDNPLSTGDQKPVQCDLDSIVTHEAGHFLGLAHSPVESATMFANYACGTTALRTLDPDDIAGICAIYPANRKAGACNDTPRHGYSSACASPEVKGCTACAAVPSGNRPGWLALGLGALLGALLRRRRSARRAARQ